MTKTEILLERCMAGELDSYSVLENVLNNWLPADEADEFAEREYDIQSDDYDNDGSDDEY